MKTGFRLILLFSIVLMDLKSQSAIAKNSRFLSIDSIPDSSMKIYRETPAKINDLVHTKLEVRFDYARHYLYGKEWVSIKPHFYPTDSLSLDAKGMDIHYIGMQEGNIRHKLDYVYTGDILKINLGKTFLRNQIYTIYIDYTAKPEEIKQKGSAAITSAKGLYFINSDGKDPNKPIQIWTQGETESSSCWFPTLDKPNQKTTDEISMTVPSKYVTLSNGKLVLQKKNQDGTRTDTWKMELPHAPYLFMMAVGDFKIYHDHWKNKEVNYYLEPKYAPYAHQIFGNTPEMMSYYAKITGIDFPWNKYSQIVVRDYVSGAMENTTATLHGEGVQKTARELLDEDQETVICHELFHQWFGDYVTCESWSNITLNESFATLAEILWTGHKKGKEAEDAERYDKLHTYLNGTQNGDSPSLVRFHYADREDVFDNVSYPKGSVILYGLKNLIGDDAFYSGLNLYLKTNAFKTAEAPQLRLAFEQVTGMDLNWYFNQWYYGEGHPILDIESNYSSGFIHFKINQVQDSILPAFRLPIKIGLYHDGKMETRSVILDKRSQSLSFPCESRPNFIDWDIDKILVGEIRDHKSPEEYAFSYIHAPSFSNRMEAVQNALKDPSNSVNLNLLIQALKDPYYSIRRETVQGLDLKKPEILEATEPELFKMSTSDPKMPIRANCIEKLCETGNSKYIPICRQGLKNDSYSVMGASLNGFLILNPEEAEKELLKMDPETKSHLDGPIANYYASKGEDIHEDFYNKIFSSDNQAKQIQILPYYLLYLRRNINPTITQNGVDNILKLLSERHNTEDNHEFIAIFRGISGAKTDEASVSSDNKLKDILLKQSQIFNKGVLSLQKN